MTAAAIKEAADKHTQALAEYQAALIDRRHARAAAAEADRAVALAQQKLNAAGAAFGRLVGETGENE